MSGLDVVGIGALNLDYIVDARDLSVPFETGTESVVEEATIREVPDSRGSAPLEVTLGGSAYNAIFALAQLRSGLKLGHIGVAGLLPRPGVSSVEELRRNGVDTSLIYETDEALSGVCFSLVHSGERTLLTHAGANDLMAEKLDQHFSEVLAHLRRARVVHVTSFLNDATPKVLLRVLRALRASRPDVLITFDPGHVWASEPTTRSPIPPGPVTCSRPGCSRH